MPTLLETASELDKLLKNGWGSKTPIAVDNIPFKEVKGQSYLSTKFIPYNTEDAIIGSFTCKRKRTVGVLSIMIRTPLESGIGLAYSFQEDISKIMDNQCLLSNLFTLTSDVRRVGDENDGWFKVICDIPFTSDNI